MTADAFRTEIALMLERLGHTVIITALVPFPPRARARLP
jgi:hypothetical protein